MFGILNFFSLNNKDDAILEQENIQNVDTEKRQKLFIETAITQYKNSPERKFMDVAQRYYENDNDILKAKRMIVGKSYDNSVALFESKLLANNKLCHNFMKKLTRQKISYMLGKPFDLVEKEQDDTKALEFFKDVKKYFNRNFFKMLKNVGRDSIVKGLGWLQVYYENGTLGFKRIPPEQIIPIWGDSDHTILDGVIRFYNVRYFYDDTLKDREIVEFCTPDGTYHYYYNEEGKLVRDPNYEFPETHFVLYDDNENPVMGVNWLKVPFVPFKYDPDEQSLLKRIKTLVDDYDKKESNRANMIDDIPNAIKVIKNYDGKDKEEFAFNVNQYRMMFVQDEGDAKNLETPLNIADLDVHLQRLREDIYEFGQGVNTADREIRDTSGVALRFIYADLDMDCTDWGNEYDWSLRELLWFVIQDIKSKTGKDYSDVEYGIVFNTDVIINESETIQNCLTSANIISRKTIAANHPWTLNADKEMKDLINDETEKLKLELEYSPKQLSSTGGNNNNGGSNQSN